MALTLAKRGQATWHVPIIIIIGLSDDQDCRSRFLGRQFMTGSAALPKMLPLVVPM